MNNDRNNNNNAKPPTHRWSSVLGLLNVLPLCIHGDRLNSYDPTSLELKWSQLNLQVKYQLI